METASPTKVAICIITLHRPNGLHALLERISQLSFEEHPAPSITIVVVDNDPTGSGKAVCDDLVNRLGLPIEYYIEPRKGIPFARNKSVEVMKDRVDFCTFIDDDEVPEHDWLERLLSCQRTYQADVVAGPVVTRFLSEPPPWIREGNFFARPRRATGSTLQECFTNNTLARATIFNTLKFDERFALTGGSDTQLFMRVAREGYRIIWCDEAIAYETLPESRMRIGWLLQRSYRGGNSYALTELSINPSATCRLQRAVKGIYRLLEGVIKSAFSLSNRPRLIEAIATAYLGAGMIAGAAGIQYKEYRKIHRI
jgi:cellulose synthase/poly-beta-1,6-N-acetylglucosamine synthase-like glycosyltransferase